MCGGLIQNFPGAGQRRNYINWGIRDLDQDVIFLEFLVITTVGRPLSLLCNNPEHPALLRRTTVITAARTKMLIWLLLSALTASMTYLIFRGYLSPDLLLGFANSFSC